VTVGLVSRTGEILGQARCEPLGDDHDPNVIVRHIARMVQKVLASQSVSLGAVAGVGVCSPGLLDFDKGLVKAAANLRGWRDVPLTQLMADQLGIDRSRVVLENDGNTALLAELWIGAAKGKKDVVLLTLGTGIGSGIVSGGQLVRGCNGQAGELGHSILIPEGRPNKATGVQGIWEMYASATAVVARAKEGIPADSTLHGLGPEGLGCKEVFKHAADGDTYAQGVVKETARFLAIGCINCARCLDPQLILFTGGMAEAGDQLLTQVREQFALHHWSIAPVRLEFRIADSPAHAGLLGAAYAALLAIDF